MNNPAPETETPAGRLSRWGSRFLVCYFSLTNLDDMFKVVAEDYWPMRYPQQLWHQFWWSFVPWLGRHGLGISSPIAGEPNGSGDRPYDWILAGCFVVLALGGVLLWGRLDRGGRHEARVTGWARWGVRYTLAFAMLFYGFIKLAPTAQLPAVGPYRLAETYGDFSPMGVLWAFMGSSPAYTALTALAELLAGGLLLFRRTALPGALLTVAVMANVTALNLCYDVPVKLYSAHLLLRAVWLVWPEWPRLRACLLQPRWALTPPVRPQWLKRSWGWIKALVIAYFIYDLTVGYWLDYREDSRFLRSELYGIWEVDSFVRDGEEHPPLLTDPVRWRRVVVERNSVLHVNLMATSPYVRYATTYDAAGHRLTLATPGAGEDQRHEFTWARPAPDRLELTGRLDGHAVSIRLHRTDEQQYLLLSRGFHWVSGRPFNR